VVHCRPAGIRLSGLILVRMVVMYDVVYKFIISDRRETPWLEVWAATHEEAASVARRVFPRSWTYRVHNTHEEMILSYEQTKPEPALLTS
jgi:hypothetical protein